LEETRGNVHTVRSPDPAAWSRSLTPEAAEAQDICYASSPEELAAETELQIAAEAASLLALAPHQDLANSVALSALDQLVQYQTAYDKTKPAQNAVIIFATAVKPTGVFIQSVHQPTVKFYGGHQAGMDAHAHIQGTGFHKSEG